MSLKSALKFRARRFVTYLLEPSVLRAQRKLDRLTAYQADDHPLRRCGCRYFSQNDEDGILLEILRRLEIEDPQTFLELGVGDGTENNTIILLAKRWRGAWLGGEDLAFELPTKGSRLAFTKCWITRDNVVQLANQTLASFGQTLRDASVISVDLDGNDASIVKALLGAGAAPVLFLVEYNAKFAPGVEFEMPYEATHVWQLDGDYFGVSLLRWTKIFDAAGYSLVACNGTGANAFFVRIEMIGKFADVPKKIEEQYRPGYYVEIPQSGHRTEPRTIAYLASS